jgi:hypothetical protein
MRILAAEKTEITEAVLEHNGVVFKARNVLKGVVGGFVKRLLEESKMSSQVCDIQRFFRFIY